MVERFQQTLKNWFRSQSRATDLNQLQTQLDTFRAYYNDIRPHRALHRHPPPAQAYAARGKATPAGDTDGHWRIRDDRVDKSGIITIRYHSKLHHIGIGRALTGHRVRILIHDRNIRIIDPETGELLREPILDPTRDYQPQKPQNPLPKKRVP